jgi:hypothetical protein
MESENLYHEERSEISLQTKYMANDFYRSLTNAMREYVVSSINEDESIKTERLSYNIWTMMRCFWFSFKYSSSINEKDKEEMDGCYYENIEARIRIYDIEDERLSPELKEKLKERKKKLKHGVLSKSFTSHEQAFVAMDTLFEKAGKAGIFIDYSMQLGDYDPESPV